MYGSMPYMFPNAMIQTAPINTGLANATNLVNGIGTAKTGLSGFLSKINFSSILSNAQKTLNVVNQAVPLYYQVKPVFKNIRALGRIGKEFKNISSNNATTLNQTSNNINNQNNINNTNEHNNVNNDIPNPTFFL